eukprot:31479-Pelagococcus_subviridis.AAC.8
MTRCAHRYPKRSSSSATYAIAGGCGGSSLWCHIRSPGTFSSSTHGTLLLSRRRKTCDTRLVCVPWRNPGRERLLVETSWRWMRMREGFRSVGRFSRRGRGRGRGRRARGRRDGATGTATPTRARSPDTGTPRRGARSLPASP